MRRALGGTRLSLRRARSRLPHDHAFRRFPAVQRRHLVGLEHGFARDTEQAGGGVHGVRPRAAVDEQQLRRRRPRESPPPAPSPETSRPRGWRSSGCSSSRQGCRHAAGARDSRALAPGRRRRPRSSDSRSSIARGPRDHSPRGGRPAAAPPRASRHASPARDPARAGVPGSRGSARSWPHCEARRGRRGASPRSD